MIQVLGDWTVHSWMIFCHWINKEGTLETHRCKWKWTDTFSDLLRHAFWSRHTHLLNQRRTDSSSSMNMVCHAACPGILKCPFSFSNSETWFEICCFRDYRVFFWYFCVIISSYDTYIFKLSLLLPCVHIACVCAFTHVMDLCAFTHVTTCVELRGLLWRIDSLLQLLCGVWGLSSGLEACVASTSTYWGISLILLRYFISDSVWRVGKLLSGCMSLAGYFSELACLF